MKLCRFLSVGLIVMVGLVGFVGTGYADESKATLISPYTSVSNQITFTWNAVSNSTWYLLWVDDSNGNKIKQWYSAAESNCESSSICSITPSITFNSGDHVWWIQTWIDDDVGDWSDGMSFTVDAGNLPDTATLVSPLLTITDTTPTYTWNAVSNSTWYYLWVSDSIGTPIKKWYTAQEANCESGTGTCSVTPSITLETGNVTWWVQTWNFDGFGNWSDGMGFTLASDTDQDSYENYYRPLVTSGNHFTFSTKSGGRVEIFVEEGTVQFNNSTVKVLSLPNDTSGYYSLNSNGLAYHGKSNPPSILTGPQYEVITTVTPPILLPIFFEIGDTFTTNGNMTITQKTDTYWEKYTGNYESTINILENETISIPLGIFSAVKIRTRTIVNYTYAENSYGASKTEDLGEMEEISEEWYVKDIGYVKMTAELKVDGSIIENAVTELLQINF